MRLVVLLVMIAAAAGGGWWWWMNRDPSAERALASAELQRTAARVGLHRMLREVQPYEFSDIVVGGRLENGDWDFRAMLMRGGTPRAAYGQARPVCPSGLEDPRCWQIAYLESQGSAIDVPAPDLAAAPATAEDGGDGGLSLPVPPRAPEPAEPVEAPVAAVPEPAGEASGDPVLAALPSAPDPAAEVAAPEPGAIEQTALPEPSLQGTPPTAQLPGAPAPDAAPLVELEDSVSRFPAFPPPRPTQAPDIGENPVGDLRGQQGTSPDLAVAGQASRTEDRAGDDSPVQRPPGTDDTQPGDRTAPAEPELTVESRVYELGAPLPDMTHEVALPLINARAGPSTSEPIITTLPEGTALSLLELRAGWGRFVILEGNLSGAEGWVAMSLLEEVF